MTAREQLVWAARYAALSDHSVDAVRLADQAVRTLRTYNVDNERFLGPEYEAARSGPGLTFDEFRLWYPVALKIARRHSPGAEEVDAAACQRAYDSYRQSASDFY